MSVRIWSIIGALFFWGGAHAQPNPTSTTAPKIAILELELGKGIKNNAIARDDFKRLSAEELSVPPISGERPSNLLALFSCAEMDVACLTQISTSLKVRFVLYGSLEVSGSNEQFSVSLFDAEAAKILATQPATFASENRSKEIQKAIQQVLSAKGAEAIRSTKKMASTKERAPGRGLWKLAVPVILTPGVAIFGISARNERDEAQATLNTDLDAQDIPGAVSAAESKLVFKKALASDVFLVATLGSATWAILSLKKNQKTTEQTAVNP